MKLTQEQKDARNAKRKATIERKKAEAAAEAEEKRRLFDLQDAKDKVRTEPSRSFLVGEEVVIGNSMDAKVIEDIDGGKVYRLERPSGELCYYPWHNVIKKGNFSEKQFSQEDTMRLTFYQMTMGDVINSFFYSFGTDLNPDYQRDLVWDLEDKIALLDSIFNNRDIGQFVFIHLGYEDPGYELLDGKQRLSAIIEFIEDRYEYHGMKYSQLHPKDRHRIKGYNISVATTREKLTKKQKLEYFLSLNTRGKDQTAQHLAKVRGMLVEEIENEKENEQ
jgi:hypothetical protein